MKTQDNAVTGKSVCKINEKIGSSILRAVLPKTLVSRQFDNFLFVIILDTNRRPASKKKEVKFEV